MKLRYPWLSPEGPPPADFAPPNNPNLISLSNIYVVATSILAQALPSHKGGHTRNHVSRRKLRRLLQRNRSNFLRSNGGGSQVPDGTGAPKRHCGSVFVAAQRWI